MECNICITKQNLGQLRNMTNSSQLEHDFLNINDHWLLVHILFQNWSNPTCVSYNFSQANGTWTSMGCKVLSVDEVNGIVLCGCNHLTNFGVLVVS